MNLLNSNFSLEKYCERIAYCGPLSPDINCVNQLIRHQIYNVPFENLDVLTGKIVSLEPADIVEKILVRRRGGYCYEVNGLFAMALHALKIPYSIALARPLFYPERRARTHMVIIAEVEGTRWLCDLGFGSFGPRQAVNLRQSLQEFKQDHDRFQLSFDNSIYRLSAWLEDGWQRQYEFTLEPQEWVDIIPANYFNSTHPNSIFVQKLLVMMPNATGKTILFGDQLKIIHNGSTQISTVTLDQQKQILKDVFGLHNFTGERIK